MQEASDVVVVGGGIVGLATAFQLGVLAPGIRICLLEKEPAVCLHQSGRNSGVLHSGIYYVPGSAKATTCRAGKKMLEEFCRAHAIPFELCGKVIVATEEKELPSLQKIFERGMANGVQCRRIDDKELHEIEPHARGVAAIHVPETGIVDYPGVCQKLAELLVKRGDRVVLSAEVQTIERKSGRYRIGTTSGSFESKSLINCAGLHCDRVMKLSGIKPPAKIVPFRGEYYELSASAEHLCRNLIYPVPDPEFPFLGVHFTRMVSGGVECGPNAVLALAREGYDWKTIKGRDLFESLTYTGFLKIAFKYWKSGAGEMHRSISKAAFVKALQRLVPAIRSEHLTAAPAGVRAQAISPDGKMVDDFLFADGEDAVHVCNAPSPAATASLKIGEIIARRLLDKSL